LPVRMRLHRVGAKHQPSYRIVVTPALTPRDGSYLDQVGYYNPRTEPPTVNIEIDKVVSWLQKGVQPSDRVIRLLETVNIVPEAVRRGEPIPTEPIVRKDRRQTVTEEPESVPVKSTKSKKDGDGPVVATSAPGPATTSEPATEDSAAASLETASETSSEPLVAESLSAIDAEAQAAPAEVTEPQLAAEAGVSAGEAITPEPADQDVVESDLASIDATSEPEAVDKHDAQPVADASASAVDLQNEGDAATVQPDEAPAKTSRRRAKASEKAAEAEE
jgi:small subunit ribosomal protein S16